MTSLRWGILATGGIARLFANDLVLNQLDLRAVGSRTQESADAFAADFSVPNAHGSYEDLVADPEVDIIYIATPHPSHVSSARLALNAGKHVLIEKPLTVNAAEAEEIRQLAADKGLLVLEAMWTRYLPHMVRIREILAAGSLGEVRYLQADHSQSLSTEPNHRLNDLRLGGGALLDLGIYPVSFAWEIFGAPATVQSTARMTETGVDGTIATLFSYASGAIATSISTLDAKGPNVATIVGTEGRIDIDAVWYTPTSFRVIDRVGVVVEDFSSSVIGRGMHFQARAAEELVASGEITGGALPIAESVAIMKTLDEIRHQIGLSYPGE